MITPKPMLQCVLFDFDGTIANTDPLHFECWRKLLLPYNKTIDTKFYSQNCAGRPSKEAAKQVIAAFPDINMPSDDLACEKDAYLTGELLALPVKLMPGIRDLIRFLAQNAIPIGLVTESSQMWTNSILTQTDIAHYFHAIITQDEVSEHKPSPQSYLTAIQNLKVDPASTIVLEDTIHGVKAAKAAGLFTCAVPNAFTYHHNLDTADLVCTDLSNLSSYIYQTFSNIPVF